jgi:hypothetical protein
MQKLLVQHPEQDIGPQAAITHAPLTHCSPKPQVWQVPMFAPHASGESPARH